MPLKTNPNHFTIKIIFRLLVISFFFSACSKDIAKKNIITRSVTFDTTNYNPVDIVTGGFIYGSNYIDQPYIIKMPNGNWICFYTYSPTKEQASDETVGISISKDKGKTWTYSGDLEPKSGPDAYYAIPFINANGRIYVIYTYNIDNTMVDSLYDVYGKMCYKYTDDNGQTWSKRNIVNIPITYIDLHNGSNDNGKHQSWWTIDKPILATDGGMYFAFTKSGLYDTHEGFIVKSPNINTETDTSKLIWNFYPKGDHGIKSPAIAGAQEEFNIQQLNSGGFICVYRTVRGYPMSCYSNDSCKTWSVPQPMLYANGDTIRTPRACPKVFKCANGKYLLWFHNDSYINGHRNPVWISGGIEKNGVVSWSQPELLMYSTSLQPYILISYPDLVEDNGNYYMTETQKKTAVIHPISAEFLDRLWAQGNTSSLVNDFLAGTFTQLQGNVQSQNVPIPNNNGLWTGISIEMEVNTESSTPNSTLITAFGADNHKVMQVVTRANGNFGVDLYTNEQKVISYDCDSTMITPNGKNIISFMLENKSRVISSMVNGVLRNGNYTNMQGWARLPSFFKCNPIANVTIVSPAVTPMMRMFNVGMRTSDMISEYNYLK